MSVKLKIDIRDLSQLFEIMRLSNQDYEIDMRSAEETVVTPSVIQPLPVDSVDLPEEYVIGKAPVPQPHVPRQSAGDVQAQAFNEIQGFGGM